MIARIGWAVLLLGLVVPRAYAATADALALQQRVVEVFEQNRDAVVRVKAAYRKPEKDGKQQVTLRMGTGFFVSREGHVLVSASRAAGADRVWIEFKDQSYATEMVGHDRLTNVSMLRVLEPPEGFSIIPIDTNGAGVGQGALAIAISCPLDFPPSPSLGMVTGRDKKLGNKIFPTEYIRTSISVEAGRGGCPVLDINGRFVGMTVASIPELDASYCLPVEALARVRDDLLFAGRVIHSWMGFEVAEDVDTERPEKVYLSRVIEGAPAAKAGLQKGDRLIAINGREIEEAADVPGAVFFIRANQFAPIRVRRDGEVVEVSVKTVPRPEQKPIIRDVDGPDTPVPSEAGTPAEQRSAEPADAPAESAAEPEDGGKTTEGDDSGSAGNSGSGADGGGESE